MAYKQVSPNRKTEEQKQGLLFWNPKYRRRNNWKRTLYGEFFWRTARSLDRLQSGEIQTRALIFNCSMLFSLSLNRANGRDFWEKIQPPLMGLVLCISKHEWISDKKFQKKGKKNKNKIVIAAYWDLKNDKKETEDEKEKGKETEFFFFFFFQFVLLSVDGEEKQLKKQKDKPNPKNNTRLFTLAKAKMVISYKTQRPRRFINKGNIVILKLRICWKTKITLSDFTLMWKKEG
jgi:hypothetical protein